MSAAGDAPGRRIPRRALLAAGGAVALAAAGGIVARQAFAPAADGGIAVEPRPPAPEISLVDHDGRPFKLSALRGTPALLFFGYISCEDVCPITLAAWAAAARELGARADQARYFMVSVDPTFDTPERLRVHLSRFDPRFVGLTGPLDDVERVVSQFGVFVINEPNVDAHDTGRPVLRHSATTFGIDRGGRIARLFRLGTPPEGFAAGLGSLVAERDPR